MTVLERNTALLSDLPSTTEALRVGLRGEWVNVTPELARIWLSANHPDNRRMDKTSAYQLAGDMKRGEWLPTQQGIAFDEQGLLLDGQHRLMAITLSGCTIPLLVWQGAKREWFPVLDTGRPRTGAEVLSMEGYTSTKVLRSAARGLFQYETFKDSTSWGGAKARQSNRQVLELVADHPGLPAAVAISDRIRRATFLNQTAAAVGWYVTTPHPMDSQWLEGLVSGVDLAAGDPRLALRTTVLNMRARKRQSAMRLDLGLYIKAWNAFLTHRSVRTLSFRVDEKLPTPVNRAARQRTGA